MSRQDQLDIAIIGGGIAGLCLAIGLLRNGNAKVTIYEAAHHFGEIDAGLALGPSAQRAMRGIDPAVETVFREVATGNGFPESEPVYFEYRVGEGVEAGTRFHVSLHGGGDRTYGVYRATFLDGLVKLIPDGVAQFGKRVVGIEQADGLVHLKFKDGAEAAHHSVIGCDGIHSEMRKYILGPKEPASYAVFSGKYCHRGLAPMKDAVAALGEELAMHPVTYIGKHAHMLTFPVNHGATFNAVAFGSCPTWDDERWVVHGDSKNIDDDFAAFGEPVKKIIDLMHDTDIWALFNHLPTKTYRKGNVAIMGDAAHATTPHQGSGAGMAIEDAFVLSSMMKHVKNDEEIARCLAGFDAVRRARGNRLVETSREAGQIWDMEFPETGEDLEKIGENASARMHWIWSEDLDKEVEEGLKVMEG